MTESETQATPQAESNTRLQSLVERVERLEAEKQTVADDIKEVYDEAKAVGYDAKIIRKIVAMRKRSADEISEEAALLDLYLAELGMSL